MALGGLILIQTWLDIFPKVGGSMTGDHNHGLDPKKIEIVKSCLETAFKNVRHRQEGNNDLQCFLFTDGTHSSQLVIDRTFLDGIRRDQLVWLENYMRKIILLKLKANAGKKVSVSNNGMDVSEKDPD
jgi:hypothetical protein